MSPSPLASPPPVSATSTQANRGESNPRTQRNEWKRVLARLTFLVFTGTAVFLYVFSLPTYYAQLVIVCPGLPDCSFFGHLSQGMLPWFRQAHLSVSVYAASFLALVSLNALLALIFASYVGICPLSQVTLEITRNRMEIISRDHAGR